MIKAQCLRHLFLCEEGASADLLASICNSKIDRAHLCAKV